MNWNTRYALDMNQVGKWPCDCSLCSKLNNTNLENACIDCGSTTEPLKITREHEDYSGPVAVCKDRNSCIGRKNDLQQQWLSSHCDTCAQHISKVDAGEPFKVNGFYSPTTTHYRCSDCRKDDPVKEQSVEGNPNSGGLINSLINKAKDL